MTQYLLAGAATVVRQSGDDFLITDGPYAQTKVHLDTLLPAFPK